MMKFTLQLFLVAPLLLFLTACPDNPPEEAPSAGSISRLSAKVAACELSLRDQMESKKLLLHAVTGMESDISEMNESTDQTSAIEHTVEMKKKEVTSIGLSHFISSGDAAYELEYDLSVGPSYSEAKLSLEVSIERKSSNQSKEIEQNFSISEDCEATLISTEVITYTNTGNRSWRYKSYTRYLNGEDDTKTDDFEVPQDLPFANFLPNDLGMNDLPPKMSIYIPKMGILEMAAGAAPDKKVKEFGRQILLKGIDFQTLHKGKDVFSMYIGEDSTQDIRFTSTKFGQSWTVPLGLWKTQRLGTVSTDNSVRFKAPKDYLENHKSILLESPKEPDYDHFSAYWSIVRKGEDSKTGKKKFILTEAGGTISDTSTPKDLESNDTIQTTLPEIQKIAESIRSRAGNQRKEKVAQILEYLDKNYKYDDDMAKFNTVRPLTTAEALKRGKGVCQHYAVIFTAIARALDVPTRIVGGYHLRGTPVGHAWVEVEIKPGLWQVIEPQLADGLTKTETRFYFPTGRGTFFEDKDSSLIDYVMSVVDMDLTFWPAE